MTEPVKLSRERWNNLVGSMVTNPQDVTHTRRIDDASIDMVRLTSPRDLDGITFLPATYVPRDAHR